MSTCFYAFHVACVPHPDQMMQNLVVVVQNGEIWTQSNPEPVPQNSKVQKTGKETLCDFVPHICPHITHVHQGSLVSLAVEIHRANVFISSHHYCRYPQHPACSRKIQIFVHAQSSP